MSMRAHVWAVEQSVGDPLAKYVLLTLADFYNDALLEAWPSIDLIAHRTELSLASVKRKLEYLESKGLIARRQVKTAEKGWTNTRYTFPPLAHTEPSPGSHRAKPLAQAEPLTLSTTLDSLPLGPGLFEVSPIPPDWTPDPEDLAWAARRHPKVDCAHEAERFRDHFLGSGEQRRSWPAVFREWVRRADRPRPAGQPPRRAGLAGNGRGPGAGGRAEGNRERVNRARRELGGPLPDDPAGV